MQFNKDTQRISPWGKNDEPRSIRNKWPDSTRHKMIPRLQQITNSAEINNVVTLRKGANPTPRWVNTMSHARHERALALHSTGKAPARTESTSRNVRLILETSEGSNSTEKVTTECDLQLKLERSGLAQPRGEKIEGNLATSCKDTERRCKEYDGKTILHFHGERPRSHSLTFHGRARSDTSTSFKTVKHWSRMPVVTFQRGVA